MSPSNPLPPAEGPMETQVASQLRNLWAAVIVLGAGLLAVAALATYGFLQAGNAADQAGSVARSVAQAALQANEATKQSTAATHEVARTALHDARALKRQRDAAILRACRDQNQRHDNSLAYLRRLSKRQIARAPTSRKASVRHSVGRSLAQLQILFQALVPKRNCARVLAASS